jgi:hypothetical protein
MHDEGLGLLLLRAAFGLVGLAFSALMILIGYGVVLLIFRHAFGLELPNPIEWLPAEWRQKSPAAH